MGAKRKGDATTVDAFLGMPDGWCLSDAGGCGADSSGAGAGATDWCSAPLDDGSLDDGSLDDLCGDPARTLSKAEAARLLGVNERFVMDHFVATGLLPVVKYGDINSVARFWEPDIVAFIKGCRRMQVAPRFGAHGEGDAGAEPR